MGSHLSRRFAVAIGTVPLIGQCLRQQRVRVAKHGDTEHVCRGSAFAVARFCSPTARPGADGKVISHPRRATGGDELRNRRGAQLPHARFKVVQVLRQPGIASCSQQIGARRDGHQAGGHAVGGVVGIHACGKRDLEISSERFTPLLDQCHVQGVQWLARQVLHTLLQEGSLVGHLERIAALHPYANTVPESQ